MRISHTHVIVRRLIMYTTVVLLAAATPVRNYCKMKLLEWKYGEAESDFLWRREKIYEEEKKENEKITFLFDDVRATRHVKRKKHPSVNVISNTCSTFCAVGVGVKPKRVKSNIREKTTSRKEKKMRKRIVYFYK